jgi:hypothetical protein
MSKNQLARASYLINHPGEPIPRAARFWPKQPEGSAAIPHPAPCKEAKGMAEFQTCSYTAMTSSGMGAAFLLVPTRF